METFCEMVLRLKEVHGWSRRMCILAARIYKGIDTANHYQAGIMNHPSGRPMLTQGEYMEITNAW
jgi:hypothetical protein